jgi:hypothetical protein
MTHFDSPLAQNLGFPALRPLLAVVKAGLATRGLVLFGSRAECYQAADQAMHG